MAKGVQAQKISTRNIVIIALMISLTVVLGTTPMGTIKLPLISITIAHIPTIVTAIVFGLGEGLAVGLALGLTSLVVALTTPVTLLDPFFVNPLISVLPRLMIPVTAHFSYRGLKKIFSRQAGMEHIVAGVSVAIGNLTNTFGVYTMLYLVYARQIFEKSGTPALNLIIAAISTTTLIKCIAVVIICVPVIYALNKVAYPPRVTSHS